MPGFEARLAVEGEVDSPQTRLLAPSTEASPMLPQQRFRGAGGATIIPVSQRIRPAARSASSMVFLTLFEEETVGSFLVAVERL